MKPKTRCCIGVLGVLVLLCCFGGCEMLTDPDLDDPTTGSVTLNISPVAPWLRPSFEDRGISVSRAIAIITDLKFTFTYDDDSTVEREVALGDDPEAWECSVELLDIPVGEDIELRVDVYNTFNEEDRRHVVAGETVITIESNEETEATVVCIPVDPLEVDAYDVAIENITLNSLGEEWFSFEAEKEVTKIVLDGIFSGDECFAAIAIFDEDGRVLQIAEAKSVTFFSTFDDAYYVASVYADEKEEDNTFTFDFLVTEGVPSDLHGEITKVEETADGICIDFTIHNDGPGDVINYFTVYFWAHSDTPISWDDGDDDWGYDESWWFSDHPDFEDGIDDGASLEGYIDIHTGRTSGTAYMVIDPHFRIADDDRDNNIISYEWEIVPVDPDGYEPDNTPGDAETYVIGEAYDVADADGDYQSRTIHVRDDVDWIQFTAEEGTTYIIETEGAADEDPAEIIVRLYAENDLDTPIKSASSDDGASASTRIDYTSAAGGVYYIKVNSYYLDEDFGLGTGAYLFRIREQLIDAGRVYIRIE